MDRLPLNYQLFLLKMIVFLERWDDSLKTVSLSCKRYEDQRDALQKFP